MNKRQKSEIFKFLGWGPQSAFAVACWLNGSDTAFRDESHLETLAYLTSLEAVGELERDAQGRWCLPREPGSPGRPRGRGAGVRDHTIPVKVTAAEIKRWKAAAKTSGESLSAWLRSALDDAAQS
jgi:hypothetical protein